MIREIRRIEPVSAIRIGFLIGLAAGIIVGLLESVVLRIMSNSSGSQFLPPGAEELITMSGGMLVILAIVMGLMFSLVFALLGGLLALLYNIGARLFGGLEIHLAGDEAQHTARPSDHDFSDGDSHE